MIIKIEKTAIQLVTVLSFQALIIIIYFQMLRTRYDDPAEHDLLNVKIVNGDFISKNCCSSWPISHFFSFMIFAYIWPQHKYLLFFMGVLWEVIEGIINKFENWDKKIDDELHQATRDENNNVDKL